MITKGLTVIGLTGYAGTGKDTVRAILEESGFTGLAFAEPIRGMIRELLTSTGISDDYMDTRLLKEVTIPALGVSYRQMAQTLGTEWGRALHSDLWLRIAGAFMGHQISENDVTNFVISDVRFANEAAFVRNCGGVIWRIERLDATPVHPHASEAGVDSITPDHIIPNDGTLDDLRSTVADAIGVLA